MAASAARGPLPTFVSRLEGWNAQASAMAPLAAACAPLRWRFTHACAEATSVTLLGTTSCSALLDSVLATP